MRCRCGRLVKDYGKRGKKHCSKRCARADRALAWYHRNRERAAAKHKEYYQREDVKQVHAARMRNHRARQRDRRFSRAEYWDYRIMEQMAALVAHRAELGILRGGAGVFWE